MPDYTIAFKQNKPILDLYKRLKKDGVADEQIDRGYMKTDWVKKKRIPVGPGDHKLEAQEVLDYALEHYERYQLDIKETTGYIVSWSLDDLDPTTTFDEEIRGKINKAIHFFEKELEESGYKKGTDRHQELMALCLFAFVISPIDGSSFSEYFIFEDSKLKAKKLGAAEFIDFFENQGRLPEIENAGLIEVAGFLRQYGGLGIMDIDMPADCELEATALEALGSTGSKCGACTEKSSILYSVFKMAGLKAAFVEAMANDTLEQIRGEDFSGHVAVALILSNKKRIFDPTNKMFDAGSFFNKDFDWWFELSNREFFAEYFSNSGKSYADMKNTDKAIEMYKKAIEINPEDAMAFSNLGCVYGDMGEFDLAIEACKHAIEINPKYAPAYNNLGRAYVDKGEDDLAIEACKHAIEINPKYATAYYNLGNAYGDKDKFNLAIEAYKKAIEFNPKHAKAYYQLGLADAIKAGEFLKKGEKSQALLMFQEALKSCKQARNLGHNRASQLINVLQGDIERLKGNPKEAPSEEEKKNDDEDMKKLDETKQKLDKAVADKKTTPAMAKEYCDLGYQYYINNQEEKALDSYKKATTIDPQSQDAWLGLWRCYKSLGDKENTKKACEKYKTLSKSPMSCEE